MQPSRSIFAARRFVPPRSTAHTRPDSFESGDESPASSLSPWERVGERDLHEVKLVDVFSLRTKTLAQTLSQSEREVQLRFSSSEHIEANRGHQHAAFDYVLRPVFDIQKRDTVIEARHNLRDHNRSE